jgi:ribosomal protein S27AE
MKQANTQCANCGKLFYLKAAELAEAWERFTCDKCQHSEEERDE